MVTWDSETGFSTVAIDVTESSPKELEWLP